MTLIPIALLFASASAQRQTVTFTHPCAHSAVVLEALGQELNLTLKPSGSVTKDYFLVRFKDVPVQEAFDKIAETLNATWTQKNDVYYLGRTGSQETADFEGEFDDLERRVRAAIEARDDRPFEKAKAESLVKLMRELGPVRTSEDSSNWGRLADKGPGQAALYRLLQTLDIGSVLRSTVMPVRFGFSGLLGAKLFPDGAEQVFRQLAAEWAVFNEAGTRMGLESDYTMVRPYLTRAGTIEELKENVMLSVHTGRGWVQFQLMIRTERSWDWLGAHRIDLAGGGEVPEWAAALEGKAELSEVAEDSVSPTAIGRSSRALLSAILNDDERDVALSAPGELLTQAAEQQGRSLVAYLPDSAFFALAKEPQESGATLRSLVSALFTSRSVTADLDDGWLTVRPARPYSDRRRSMDREAFRRLVAQGAEFGSIPFDDFADFVATTTQDETVWVAGHLFGRSLPVTLSLPKIGLEVVRLYGLMPPAIRAKAYTTGVPFSDLGNLDSYVLPLREASNVVNEMYRPPQWGVRRAFKENQEAWQTMPQGMSWKLKAVRSKFIMPRQTESAVGAFRSFMSARAFASNMFRVQRRPDLAYGRDYQFAAVVDGVELLLEYQQGDRLTGTNGSNYADPLSPLKYVAFNDIPADLKAEIQKFYEEQKKAFERRSGGGGGE